jgi:prepilin-type N-terminal cleavage/methylation domain-containing protein
MSSFRGFTLIELLVGLAIVGLMVGGGMVSYGTFNKRQQVSTSGKELLVNLRQAQSKVNSGVKTAPGCQAASLIGYTVQASAGSLNQYTIAEKYASSCANGGTSDTYVVKTVALASGVTFQSAFTLTFRGLSGGATFTGASPLNLRMCNSNCGSGSLVYLVTVNQTGLIDDQGTQ